MGAGRGFEDIVLVCRTGARVSVLTSGINRAPRLSPAAADLGDAVHGQSIVWHRIRASMRPVRQLDRRRHDTRLGVPPSLSVVGNRSEGPAAGRRALGATSVVTAWIGAFWLTTGITGFGGVFSLQDPHGRSGRCHTRPDQTTIWPSSTDRSLSWLPRLIHKMCRI